jgi:hypothetical protein
VRKSIGERERSGSSSFNIGKGIEREEVLFEREEENFLKGKQRGMEGEREVMEEWRE